MGGCLLITDQGDVLEYLFEDAAVNVVSDERWIRLARVAAAEKYPQLAILKPTDGNPCTVCGGTGRLGEMQARCATCDGTGFMISNSEGADDQA
jgi:hypothetical protein